MTCPLFIGVQRGHAAFVETLPVYVFQLVMYRDLNGYGIFELYVDYNMG